ncbi:hypothetical protein U8M15_29165, partial [Klebsiella pneumoniae]|uniref:hypothetical protein n=1 Tax=Klebsiella pneumoniae TaxID=573 RepID=UPI002AE03980
KSIQIVFNIFTCIWEPSPFPSPGDIPDPGIEPGSPALQTDSLLTELQEKQCCLPNAFKLN